MSGVWREFPDFLERFLSHVELAVDGSGCWIFVGAHDSRGYANVVVPRGFPGAGKSRRMKAHRASVTLFRGIVLGAREGHHLHRTDGFTCSRDCVNSDHIDGKTRAAHMAEHAPNSVWTERAEWEAREEMIF